MERTVLHVDANSSYASVEYLYNPKLWGKPVSVCGDVEQRHVIILASTLEAKRLGVKTGMAIWQAQQLCKGLVLVGAHMDRYIRLSKLIRTILEEYSPCVEAYGLDEGWIEYTGCSHLFGDGVQVAHAIRNRIKRELWQPSKVAQECAATTSQLSCRKLTPSSAQPPTNSLTIAATAWAYSSKSAPA